MTTTALIVDQFVPTLLPRDAVGNHTLQTQRALAEAGVGGGVWGLVIDPECARRARLYTDWTPGRDRGRRVLLYQVASVSGGIVDFLISRNAPTSINYHNFTPPEFFDPWDPAAAGSLRTGIDELARLAGKVHVAVADSEYNAKDLRALGIPDVVVAPPFLGSSLAAQPDDDLLAALTATPGIRILFVSRLAPSKGHRHLIRVLAALRAGVDPHARLYLVGPPGPSTYMQALSELAEKVCPGAVMFTGPVADHELAAYYRAADVFLCMSEHEGFGIPLVEAMRMGVPIIALDTSAVAETLGGAGVLLRTPDPLITAETVAMIKHDSALRESLVRTQRSRALALERFPRADVIIRAMARAADA